MKTKVWKRILPLFLSIVMLFSVFAAAIPAASALEVSAPSGGSTNDDAPYYRIVFEDGILRIQLNPQKVYDLLRDGSISREDLLNFLPEDVLDTLAQGRDLSLDDLKALVSNYISPSDLSKLKEILPKEVLQDHFDLAMLEDLITVEELLSVVPIDELLNGVDDEKISALITPAALELLLNETAKDAVLTDEFIENLLDESDVLDTILSDAETKEELVKLIDGAIVDQLLTDDTIKSNLLALMDRSSTLDSILADETAKAALKNYFDSKKSAVSAFLTDPEVLELLKDMTSVHDSLVTDEVIERLISSNAINKGNVQTIFTNEQLESLIDDSVLEKLLATDHFVDNFLNDDELLNTIFTPELILELKNQGLLDPAYATDRTQLRSMLMSSAEARSLVSDEIHHHPEISLTHYWDHLDFLDLVNAIGIHSIQVFVDTHDDVYENILHTLGAAQIAEALGENVCASILQNNLAEILRTVGMPKLFTYFDRNEIVSALGGYYAILQKGYVSEEDVVTAIGGYPALMEYLPLDAVIDAIGYDTLLDFVNFNDIVTSAGGYATVFSWYSPAELQEILNAIGTDSLKDFLTSSGILQQLDFQQIAKDLLALLRSKGPQYKAFLQEAVDRFILFLNTEVASISINDTEIYSPGRFDFEAIVTSILREIPDVSDFLAMNEGDVLAQWILRATIRGEEYKLGISVEFIGDFSQLQELAAEHGDDFRWEVSDDFDIITKVAIPSVGAEIYEKVLLSSRVSLALKKKLLTAPTEVSLGDLPTFLTEISDEELQSIVDTVSEKIDVIRAKTYAKLDAALGGKAEKLAVAKAKADQILNAFTSVERIKALRDKAVAFVEGKIPAELADKTLAELYEGNQNFRFEGTISEEYYDNALALLQKLGMPEEAAVNLLVYFGNSLALEGSFDLTTTLKGIYQLTLKDSEEKTHIFYLPAGIDLSIIKEHFPSLDIDIPEGAIMPSEDTTLSDPDVWWQVDFYADGVLVQSVYYLVGTESLDPSEIPAVPEKLGYSAVWGDYTIGTQEITRVDAVYTKITYTTTIKDETLFPEDYEFELEYSQADRSLELPIPEKFGYTFMTWYIDVNLNGIIDEGDIKLERRVMFRMLRMLRSTPALDTFMIPDGEIIPEGDDLVLLAEFEITYYDITFVDYDGNVISDATLSYTPLEFDKAALTAQFPSLSLPHYTLAWYVEDTAWENYDLSLGGDVIVTSKKTPITYDVIFSVPGQTVLETTYNVENTTLPTVAIPTPPTGYETDGEWYVVSVDGEALATPIKLSEYTVAGGDLEIKAMYTAIEYTATFYNKAGIAIGTVKFTVNGFLGDLPEVPVVPGYENGKWVYSTPLQPGDMDVHPEYTLITYTVTFKYADGTTEEKTYTVEDYSLFSNLPAVPDRVAEGYKDGAWYVGDVKIDAFTPSTGDLVIEAKYTAIEYTATFYHKAGAIIGTAKFTVEGFIETIPDVPEIPGYQDGKWVYSTPLQPGDMDVHPEYTLITYTVTIKAIGHPDQTRTYTVEDTSAFDNLPTIEGYDTVTWYLITSEGESVFDKANVTYGDVVLEGRGTYTEYNVSFKVNGEEVGTDSYTVADRTITAPSIPSTFPDKPGYTKEWYVVSVGGVALATPIKLSEYEVTTGDLVIEAGYTINEYTATFYNKAGIAIGTVKFTVNGFLGDLPEVPVVPGYENGKWVYSTPLQPGDMDVHPEYTLITYTVTFKYADGTTEEKTYTVEDYSLFSNLPAVPDRVAEGYKDGAWYVGDVKIDAFTPSTGDLVIEAKYTAIEYTATFYHKAGAAIGTAKFTVEGFVETIPDVPEIPGYKDGKWVYSTPLQPADMDVHPDYTPITYTVTFKYADGTTDEKTYTVEDYSLFSNLPTVPNRVADGYKDGAWYVGDVNIDAFTPSMGNLVIEAKYSLITYTVSFEYADGTTVEKTYTVENYSLFSDLPAVPDRVGYKDGAWYVNGVKIDEFDPSTGDLVIEAKYSLITYTVTFKYADGTTDEKTYTVEDYSLFSNLPTVPNRVADGYKDGAWYVNGVKIDEFDPSTGDLVLEAKYTIITYTITFVQQDGTTVDGGTYTVEDYSAFEQTLPTLHAPLPGYENDGAWYIDSAKFEEYQYQGKIGDILVRARFTPIEYTATFKGEDGNVVGTATFTVEGFLEGKPAIPQKPGYRGEWKIPSPLPANPMDVSPEYTLITYTVNFYHENALFGSSSYTVANKNFTIPEVPAKPEHTGEWYVITSTGKIKLSEYQVTDENLGDLRIEAIYQQNKYTAYFRVDGVVIGSVTFTIETEELSGIPAVPAKRGYSGKWASYELGREDLYIDAIYTLTLYTATFKNEDGKTVGTVNFTINDTTIKAPTLPEKKNCTGAWYVVKVDGEKIDPVLLSEYTLTDADLLVLAIYDAEDGMAWLWWIIAILILIILILILLLILKKKNLPPFKRAETPPAIIAAAIPEEEEEVEEEEAQPEIPVVPIVTVESVDVETADELMSDATAIAVVETIESKVSAGQKIIVNLHVINDNFTAGDTVDLDALKSKKLVSSKAGRVKILADGTINKPLTVVADAFSVQAIKMITLTGGHAVQKKSNR